MRRDYHTYLRRFHEAKWDEEIIFDLSVPGQRGIVVPKPEDEITEEIGKGSDKIPEEETSQPSGSASDAGKPSLYASDSGSSRSGYHTGPEPGDLYYEVQPQGAGAYRIQE